VNQDSGEKENLEPLLTLGKYRKKKGEIYFGVGVNILKNGIIHTKDKLFTINPS
jgi:hypothetical protein